MLCSALRPSAAHDCQAQGAVRPTLVSIAVPYAEPATASRATVGPVPAPVPVVDTPVVTADRGYGEKAVEDALHDLGVRNVVIPRKGKPSAARRAEEPRRWLRRTVKHRRRRKDR